MRTDYLCKVAVVSACQIFVIQTVASAEDALSDRSAGAASIAPKKIGYLNVSLVKTILPEIAQFDSLENAAKSTIQADLRGNWQRLYHTFANDTPLQKPMIDEWQRHAYAAQEALNQLARAHDVRAQEIMRVAIARVAANKGIDIVVDKAAIYFANSNFENNAEDITLEVLKTFPFHIDSQSPQRLQPTGSN